jgi:flagellar hook protein FlgE
MSLSASLNAGVQGLSVNSTRLSAISDNIVNANTNGYKRVVTEFSSIAIEADSQTRYTAGGVKSYVKRDITAVGTLEATNSATDIAISGAGFFAVSPVTNPTNFVAGSEPVQLANTGSFVENAEGFLKNANGDFLLGWALNPDGTTISVAPSRNTFANLTPINAKVVKYNTLPTSEIRLSGPLPANATEFGTNVANNTVTHTEEYYDTIGNTEILKYIFTPRPSTIAGTASNVWDLSITDSATTANAGLIGRFTLTFDSATGAVPGTILSVNPVTSDADNNPLTPNTPVASGTYNNLTGVLSLGTNTKPIKTFIGLPQTVNGITQTGALNQANIRLDYKDGSGYGEYKGVEIDENGIVRAYFTNDQYRPIYQIPIVTVTNPNALEPVGGQAYSVTKDAGNISLVNSGEKLAGKIIGYALTKSTVDVAQELTQLIETQRAYSSNAKIIQTVDEMLQETTNIKR